MKTWSAFALVPSPLVAGFLVLSVVGSQTAFAAGPQGSASGAGQAPAATSSAPAGSLSVPAGTVVPLTLVSTIKSKSTKVGDAVRAVVAFPVTVGGQVAIPAGTFVEGTVTALTPQVKKTRMPDVEIHFSRLLYTNGYTASLDAASTQARNEIPGATGPELAGNTADPAGFGAGRTRIAFHGGEGFTSLAQTSQQPTVPALPTTGRNIFIGVAVGSTALFVTALLLAVHHKGHSDFLLFDAGWQFQMTLASPLGLDGTQVAAAAATPTR